MAEQKHTPGPWIVFACDGWSSIHPAGREGTICENIRNERDANLLRAAPELLAALKALVPVDLAEHPQDLASPWYDARAAIAKAEGG